MRFFGASGLMVYSALAVVVGNIQVLKATPLPVFPHPVALGTVVFSTLFLCSDILTENYGRKMAQKSVWLGFGAMVFVTVLMLITLSYPTAGEHERFYEAHAAMTILFTPAPAILVASLIAYLIAQMNDIWIFATISRLTSGKLLWLRTLVSTLVGAFIDNFVFSTLAWIVFSPSPLDFKTTFFTYVLGTYMIRVIIAIAGIPFIYISRRVKPKT